MPPPITQRACVHHEAIDSIYNNQPLPTCERPPPDSTYQERSEYRHCQMLRQITRRQRQETPPTQRPLFSLAVMTHLRESRAAIRTVRYELNIAQNRSLSISDRHSALARANAALSRARSEERNAISVHRSEQASGDADSSLSIRNHNPLFHQLNERISSLQGTGAP